MGSREKRACRSVRSTRRALSRGKAPWQGKVEGWQGRADLAGISREARTSLYTAEHAIGTLESQ